MGADGESPGLAAACRLERAASFGIRLHHVGHAVRSIEPLASAYVRRYGYEIVTPVIHDPLQTARVQFLRLAGDRTYLEFVAPDGPGSKLSNTVLRRGGLNHLCYAALCLNEAAEHLKETGMVLFSEPKPGAAFGGRRICWLMGEDSLLIELVERRDDKDLCVPGA